MISFFKRKKTENIIFLHLPKAGGTTLRHIFYDQYKHLNQNEMYTINRTKETPKFYALSAKKKQQIKLLVGHFPFGLHESLSEGFKYVTFLREPTDRTISAYFYNKGHQSSDVYNLINDSNLSLYDYLQQDIEPWANNAMTKHLAGCDPEGFKEGCTEDLFQIAVKNLQSSFISVGLTEEFDKSLEVLAHKLNWSDFTYQNKNITPVKKEKGEIDEKTLELIRQKNSYDIKLYTIGKKIFEEDLKGLANKK